MRASEKLSAPKESMGSSNMKLDRGSECQLWGPSPLTLKIFELNWAVVWMPLVRVSEGVMTAGDQDSHDVAVDDLDHDQSAVVGHDIEGLGLDIGVVQGAPT